MTARLPWQPPERRREDKAAGRREWAASRAWRQRVCSGAPAPAPPRPGPRAAAANSSPVRDHSGGHGRNGHSCENKTWGKKGERSQLRQMCREDLETPPPPAGSSRPPPRPVASRAPGPGAASDYCEGLDALGAAGRAWAGDWAGDRAPGEPWNRLRGTSTQGLRVALNGDGISTPHRKPFTPSHHPRISQILGPFCSWDHLNFSGLKCKPTETPIDRSLFHCLVTCPENGPAPFPPRKHNFKGNSTLGLPRQTYQ